MVTQPVPHVTRNDVERIVHRDYPAILQEEVFEILDEYRAERQDGTPDRVHLAALKLAEGSIQQLRIAIDTAKRDFRDILAYAEYPGYFKKINPSKQYSSQEKDRVVDEDWNQYQEWLKREF